MRKVLFTMVVAGAIAAVALVAVTGDAGAQAPAAAAIPTDPARDSALKAFIQKRFRIPQLDTISLGAPAQTPLAGVYARTVTVTNEKGNSATAMLLFDKDESKVIVGFNLQYLDLKTDAWGRVDMSKTHIEDRPTIGPADAPVTIIEFADLECPHCARAFVYLEDALNNKYKGKVRLIYKNYPLSGHQWAFKAAEATECARLQNPEAFWQFSRYFYNNQGSITPQNLQDHIDKITKSQNLDAPSLKACMNSADTAARVKQDQADAAALGVTSTPALFVDGILVSGFQESNVLDFVVESELNQKKITAR